MYTVFNYAVKNYTFIREELLVIFIFLRSAQPNYIFNQIYLAYSLSSLSIQLLSIKYYVTAANGFRDKAATRFGV